MIRSKGSFTEIPEELQVLLQHDEAAKEHFLKLSPSHQREYVQYITEARKAETRARRAGKVVEMLRNPSGTIGNKN
ncbi:MAG: YdeI/OmpD-associated family protein [bacterium]